MRLRRLLGCWLAMLLAFSGALAEEAYVVPTAGYVPGELLDVWHEADGMPRVYAQRAKGEAYLFLPAWAGELCLACGGGWRVTDASDEASVRLTDPQGDAVTLHVLRSANLRAVHLTSDDPVHQGRAYVDGDGAHKASATAALSLIAPDGAVDYSGPLTQLRGRGNTTWFWGEKKPYQIKLKRKSALLGDAPDKTWLLLAEAFDATQLHNTLAYSLSAGLGLPGPDCEPVDLYYDGEYRGTYLLCEKIEVGKGRLEIADYGDALERQYGDLSALPTMRAENRYGCAYQCVSELAAYAGASAAYLLELNEYFYENEVGWFSTLQGTHWEINTPKYCSEADTLYVSELVQRIENAVIAGGTEPETGRSLWELLDLDSLARFWLLSEYTKNPDYWFGSTYFYKPAGEEKLYAGPVWDFDISCGIRRAECGAQGWLRDTGWLQRITRMPAFQEAARRIYRDELAPLIAGLLDGRLDALSDRIAASSAMNFTLWAYGGGYNNINLDTVYDTYAENYAFLRAFLTERAAWMETQLAMWPGDTIESAALTLSYRNADVPASASLTPACDHSNIAVGALEWSAEPLADAPYNARYTVTAVLTAENGSSFADQADITVNGASPEVLSRSAERITLRFAFAAPVYEPAEYDGVDYGMIYNYDYLVSHHPEVLEECGSSDPADVLAYYADYLLGDGPQAIETFEINAFIANYEPLLTTYYMCEPYSCALHYVENWRSEQLLGMAAEARPALCE